MESPTSPADDISIVLAGLKIAGTRRPSGRNKFDPAHKRLVGIALEAAIGRAKNRAQQKGLGFDLDLEWALATAESQQFKCCLTGVPFFLESDGREKRNPYAPSFDRIDCARGYTRDNVRIVVFAVNVMLMDWGLEVFERVAGGYHYNRALIARGAMSLPPGQVRTSTEKQK